MRARRRGKDSKAEGEAMGIAARMGMRAGQGCHKMFVGDPMPASGTQPRTRGIAARRRPSRRRMRRVMACVEHGPPHLQVRILTSRVTTRDVIPMDMLTPPRRR